MSDIKASQPSTTLNKAGIVILDTTRGSIRTLIVLNRKGRWSLSKGKPEAGETLKEAATRETQEEAHLLPFGLVWVGKFFKESRNVCLHLWACTNFVDSKPTYDAGDIAQRKWVTIAEAQNYLRPWCSRLSKPPLADAGGR
jgi:ADP-ribose pyrophosphatase YjhB (NUDIX family)